MKKITLLFLLIGSQLLQAQVVANPPNPLIVCDTNNNGFTLFDLTLAEAQIIGVQDPTTIQVTYHITEIDALNGVNQINYPHSFPNAAPYLQSIYVRVESLVNGDYAVTVLDLIVDPLPAAVDFEMDGLDYELCDSNQDGIAHFDLSSQDFIIANGDTDILISYHESLLDAQDGVFGIDSTIPYGNLVPFLQTLYVRVEREVLPPSTDPACFVIIELRLIVLQNPNPVTPNPLVQIDTDGDGFEVFDLTVVSDEVLNGEPDVTLSFFETESDADSNTNPIITPEAYQNVTTPEQTIFIRVESQLTGCYSIVPLMLVVDNIPGVPSEIEDFVVFDENGDGVAEFNLTLMIPQIIGSQTGLEVSFYETEDDAQNKSNVIEEPEVYENISNPQTIYARTETIYGTYALTVFNIFADENLNTTSFELDQIRLYPNPAGDFINVNIPETYKNLNIEIVNLNGQLLLSNNFTNRTSEAVTINLSSLTPGIYFLKINSENNYITKKLIKK